jgi:hypothetical protein
MEYVHVCVCARLHMLCLRECMHAYLYAFVCVASCSYRVRTRTNARKTQEGAPYSHPEGPNIGPGSGPSWKHDAEYPEKTDLLHTGHIRGGKLLIVSSPGGANRRLTCHVVSGNCGVARKRENIHRS